MASVVACFIAVACAPADECVTDVATISAAAGIPLVPDVLTVCWVPCFCCGVPGVAGFYAVAFIPAIAVVPAVDGVFAVASFSADPGVHRRVH